MSTYKELRGLKVKYLAADPDPAAAGDVWYNTATYALKGFVGRAAWSSSAALSIARNGIGSFGIQTAAVAATGADTTPSPSENDATEHYNGSAWSNAEDFPTNLGWGLSAGTQTAGMVFGGGVAPPGNTNSVNTTTEYDGTDWTAGGDMNSQRSQASGIGTQTAGLAVAGFLNTTSTTDNSEEYNGSTWTEGDNANNARRNTGGLGTQTAGLLFGGGPPASPNNHSEEYNGSSWTEGNNLNTARLFGANNGAGTQTAGLAFAGSQDPGLSAATEAYDGTSWATSPVSLATARYAPGCGTSIAAVAIGGRTTANVSITEEYNNSFEVVTAGAWASAPNLNTAGSGVGGAGTQTAALAFGRRQPPASPNYVGLSEEYNGSSWTEGPNLDEARAYLGGCGTQTAAIGSGGFTGPAPSGGSDHVHSEEYDGTNWAEGSNMNQSRRAFRSFGTQTAAVGAGGYNGPASPGPASGFLVKTEEYDGSSWTTVEDMSTQLNNHGTAGILTAGLIFGGEGGSPHPEGSGNVVSLTWEYDGTDWTAGGALNAGRGVHHGGGIQTAAWAAAGAQPGGVVVNAEHYDGTSWQTAPNLATGRTTAGSATAAPQATGMIFGGSTSNATEAFTAETTAETASTIDFD